MVKQGSNRRKHEKTGGSGAKRTTDSRRRFSLINLVLIIVLSISLIAVAVRLVRHISSISNTHLNEDGLTHAIRYQNSVVVHGIDVSEYQDDIKWEKVKSSEADFVFIRAGYRSAKDGGLKEDDEFEDNIKGANKAGIMTGAYFFSQALNEEEAKEEAEYLLELVKPYDIDMPLVIDFELYEGGRLAQAVEAGEMPAASMYHDIVLAFCDTVEKAGYESAVYANYDMLTNYMDSSILDDEALIWAAQYGGMCHVKGNYLYWQCAEDAAVSGIKGSVDHDIWYIEPGTVYSTRAAGKKKQVSIGDCSVSFDAESYRLRDHRAKPKAVVTYNGRKLKKGRDYSLSFVKNTMPGTGYAVIRGVGRYRDWMAVPFTIEE